MFSDFFSWLLYEVFSLNQTASWAQALHFFLYDSTKILFLLIIIIFIMGVINSYFPIEKLQKMISKSKIPIVPHILASSLGALTPFCSCSSIPLFIGFVRGGIPLGVTFSFLVTSPLVNEVALAVFLGAFGWKVTITYALLGIFLGVFVGMFLGKLKLDHLLVDWVKEMRDSGEITANIQKKSFKERLPEIIQDEKVILKRIAPFVLLGIGIGAIIHGFVPENFFEQYITKENPFAVPIAVLIGVPLYSSATAIVPVVQTLVAKGIPIGTAIALMMAVVGLSFPEGVLLKQVLTTKLLAIFFTTLTIAIIISGYLLNILF